MPGPEASKHSTALTAWRASQGIALELVVLAAFSAAGAALCMHWRSACEPMAFAATWASIWLVMTLYFAVRRQLRHRAAAVHGLTAGQLLLHLRWAAVQLEAAPEHGPAVLAAMLRDAMRLAFSAASPHLLPMVSLRRRRAAPTPASADAAVVVQADEAIASIERSMALDLATERGRREERLRLAHDLHDDIGSRLLTLIYKAPTPEVENYLRQTLDDLKTLTRGLAAAQHQLADAAAEWRIDLLHRLSAAKLELQWTCVLDTELPLNVVQWSALTRILRELVSNAVAHAGATGVQVHIRLQHARFELAVTDDGHGADPRGWSHGLGLSSVRKRVKQLGGDVEWRAAVPHGTCCQVTVQRLSDG